MGGNSFWGCPSPKAEREKEGPFSEAPLNLSQPLLSARWVRLSAPAEAGGSRLPQVRMLKPRMDSNQTTSSPPGASFPPAAPRGFTAHTPPPFSRQTLHITKAVFPVVFKIPSLSLAFDHFIGMCRSVDLSAFILPGVG